MCRAEIVRDICAIAKKCNGIDVEDLNRPLYYEPYFFQACDMAFLLIELHKMYDLAVKDILTNLEKHSVNGIADCVEGLLPTGSRDANILN